MSTHTYAVAGMTCAHCVAAVSGEIERIPGVEGVAVDLGRGEVVITGDGFTDEQVRDAVDEAGYDVLAP